jgi:nicotinamide-nucleotide amidase
MKDKEMTATIAKRLIKVASEKKLRIGVAESCTGGMIAKKITDIPGSSNCFSHGIVSYSDEAKSQFFKIKNDTLKDHGAVSRVVAEQMAEGVIQYNDCDISVAVTGIAGPSGATEKKPIGTVWFSWAKKKENKIVIESELHQFDGNREKIRMKATEVALRGIEDRLKFSKSV